MSEPLDSAEYEATQVQITLLSSLIIDLPLEGFVASIERAEGIGPLLDPTLYIRASHEKDKDGLTGMDKLKYVKDLAQGLLRVKKTAEAMRDRIVEQKASA